jgi:hypothetical protein
MPGMKKLFRIFIAFSAMICLCGLESCKISYSLKGTTIDPKIKTFSVQNFNNRAPLVQARLSQNFTDALKDKIQNQTSLKLTNGFADVEFSGDITNYETRPTAITGQETAALNRFTITLKVKYVNSVNPELSFETSFTRYEDYPSSQNLASVEDDLMKLIIDTIVEDIFNKAFINW